MYLFPSIDLREGRVVRLAQGDYERQTTYAQSPVEHARDLADRGASWLHVVDLDGARSGQMSHLSVIEAITKLGSLKVQFGGGVRCQQTIDQLLDVGVQRVVLGTAALKNWTWFKELTHNDTYFNRIVLGLDARDGQLAVRGWAEQLEASALEIAQCVTQWPLVAIVYTDISSDGMMQGPNIDATRQIAGATNVPVVASGGVSSLDDLRALRQLPIEGAIVGRALYEAAFSVEDALGVFEASQ